MTEERESPASGLEGVFGGVTSRYVAYCDILGFSAKVLNDFDETLRIYKEFGDLVSGSSFKDVQATIYSDAILMTAMSLDKVLAAVQGLSFFALAKNFMI